MRKLTEVPSQESVLNAKASLRLNHVANIRVTLMLGLMTAIQTEMCLPRPAQVELELVVPTQESELSAKDSLKGRAIALLNRNQRIKTMPEAQTLGSMTAIQIEMCPPRPAQVELEQVVPTQELV